MAPSPPSTRPLVQQVPRRVGAEIVLAAPGGRDLRLGGDANWVMHVLERCDGHAQGAEITAALGPEAGELIDALLEHGVAVDAAEAWKHFHAQSSVGSGLGRAPTEAQLAAQLERSFAPSRLAGATVALDPAHADIIDLARRRRSASPDDGPRAVSFGELSAVLAGMYAGTGHHERPVPSGGGLYPLVVHVVLRGDDRPGAGLWWFHPAAAGLELVRRDDADPAALLIAHPVTDELVNASGPVVLISADLERPAEKYANRGYRFALLEAGAVMQNAYLVATELGVPIRAIGGIEDVATATFLELPASAVPLLAIVLGA
jgi:SagB-type dehydrogenase family enzyme